MKDEQRQLAAIERAMLVIRRTQGKNKLSDVMPPRHLDRNALRWIPTLEAIEELEAGATVKSVATLNGADASRTSRVVAAATQAGYIERRASQSDGRSAILALTSAGKKFVAYAHQYRRKLIAQATVAWSAEDRGQLAVLLERFADALDHE